MRLRPAPRRPPEPSAAEVSAAWQCASLLLDYPGTRPLAPVREVLPLLPDALREPLATVLGNLDATPLERLQEEYVETFDSRRRGNLFLTYFAHGDTRKRGAALLRFKQTYQAAGVEMAPDELPDHLCVVLEFAATVDLDAGRRLMLDHRAGLELLRLSLADAGSRWAPLLDVVCGPLPPLQGDERDAVRRLAEEGPPAEEVGLDPYGQPQFDAKLEEARAGGPVDLPMPALPSRRGA